MLDTPVAISSSSLSSITQTLPVTPSTDAVHAVLYSSNPLERGIVHKQGPPNPACPRENFADMNGVKEDFCDDWTAWAQDTKTTGYTTQQIFTLIFNVLVFIAMGVGTYLAFSAILRCYDKELKNVSAGLGKITAVVFKSLKQKAGEMKGMTSGFGGLGGLIALSKGKVPPQMLQQANSGALPTGITPEQIAKIQQANPDTSAAAEAKAAADKAAAEKEAAAKATAKLAGEEAAKAAKDKAKAAIEKTSKENAAKALAAATAATEAKKAAADKAAAARATAKLAGEEAAKVAKDKAAAADAAAAKKKAEEEAAAETERKRKEEEAAQAAQAATPRKQSALEALRNRKGSIGELSPEGQAKSGLLKTPGLGRGRTKPGRGRVGSTRRVGY